MTRALPKAIHLPSGAVVTMRRSEDPKEVADTLLGGVEALDGARVELADPSGKRLDPRSLCLADFHALRAIATAFGALAEPAITIACDNCGEELEARPCASLELSPFLDGDLDDPELDAPFAFAERHEIPAMPIARGRARDVLLLPVDVRAALPMFAATARRSLRLTSDVVRGLGIAAIGSETRGAVIARALTRASEESWAAIVELFQDAHYPRRLVAHVTCPTCRAENAVEAPVVREFPADFAARRSDDASGFPDVSAMERLVRKHADVLYARLGVGEVDLVLDDDVPAVDDGGVPLLGSYEPGSAEGDGGVARAPEVRLYYRTFRAMWQGEGEYDVDAEIEETIEHELMHHLAYLRGDDPEDERERATIARELRARRGETETLRDASRKARGTVSDFLYRTWPLWLLLALGAVVSVWSSR